MSDEKQGGSGSGFGWFLVGLGIGAAIGVLYAPQAGTETRESLAESARERAEYLKQKSREAAAQVNTYVDAGKEQFGDYVERGKQAVERAVPRWRTTSSVDESSGQACREGFSGSGCGKERIHGDNYASTGKSRAFAITVDREGSFRPARGCMNCPP